MDLFAGRQNNCEANPSRFLPQHIIPGSEVDVGETSRILVGHGEVQAKITGSAHFVEKSKLAAFSSSPSVATIELLRSLIDSIDRTVDRNAVDTVGLSPAGRC